MTQVEIMVTTITKIDVQTGKQGHVGIHSLQLTTKQAVNP